MTKDPDIKKLLFAAAQPKQSADDNFWYDHGLATQNLQEANQMYDIMDAANRQHAVQQVDSARKHAESTK